MSIQRALDLGGMGRVPDGLREAALVDARRFGGCRARSNDDCQIVGSDITIQVWIVIDVSGGLAVDQHMKCDRCALGPMLHACAAKMGDCRHHSTLFQGTLLLRCASMTPN